MYIMEDLKRHCFKCHKCRLASTRTNVVFGEGNEHADIMFVLINQDFRISKQRGQFVKKGNFYFMPTYHPSYLLRNELSKKDAWEDFKNVVAKLQQIQDTEKIH